MTIDKRDARPMRYELIIARRPGPRDSSGLAGGGGRRLRRRGARSGKRRRLSAMMKFIEADARASAVCAAVRRPAARHRPTATSCYTSGGRLCLAPARLAGRCGCINCSSPCRPRGADPRHPSSDHRATSLTKSMRGGEARQPNISGAIACRNSCVSRARCSCNTAAPSSSAASSPIRTSRCSRSSRCLRYASPEDEAVRRKVPRVVALHERVASGR